VHLEDTGADGLLPISALGMERFRLDEVRHTLTGERSRTAYALGDELEVRLEEANPVTGGVVFALAEAPRRRDMPARPGRRKAARRKESKR